MHIDRGEQEKVVGRKYAAINMWFRRLFAQQQNVNLTKMASQIGGCPKLGKEK